MSMDKGNDKIRVASSHFMFELTAHNDISWYKLFASTNFFLKPHSHPSGFYWGHCIHKLTSPYLVQLQITIFNRLD